MSLRKMFGSFIVAAIVALSLTSIASAMTSSASSISFSVSPLVSLIRPDQNIVVDQSVTNNTPNPVTCQILIRESGFIANLGIIAPGQNAGGQISLPPTGRVSLFTFDLSCNGNFIARRIIVALALGRF